MRSATWERPHAYKGKQTFAPPVELSEVEREIQPGCKCYCCQANRRWIEQQRSRQTTRQVLLV
jgi:hypothetical protein